MFYATPHRYGVRAFNYTKFLAGAVVTYFLLYLTLPLVFIGLWDGKDLRLAFVVLVPFVFLCAIRFVGMNFVAGSAVMALIASVGQEAARYYLVKRDIATYQATAPSRDILKPANRPEIVLLGGYYSPYCSDQCKRLLRTWNIPFAFLPPDQTGVDKDAVQVYSLVPVERCYAAPSSTNLKLYKLDGAELCVATTKLEHAPAHAVRISLPGSGFGGSKRSPYPAALQQAEAYDVTADAERRIAHWECGWMDMRELPIFPYGLLRLNMLMAPKVYFATGCDHENFLPAVLKAAME
ncbi:hypothetical protein ACG873_04975 [Mesorhizobium sp. AaZ16]|uniref:hypothetical protein n=1 Tax=Mesorhizobium sp. AaZ16 TaxID=3402289 RepID=UPI00374FB550